MSERGKSLLIRYGVTTLVGALMAAGVYFIRGGFQENVTLVERYRLLCDVFSVPGVLLVAFALLIFVSNEGMFTIFTYSFSYVFRSLIPGGLAKYKHERYADYVERKREKGALTGYSCVTITGLAFLAVAGVFMYLFYQVY